MKMLRIVLVAVVNQRGEVLLRLRDERSVVHSNRWSLPGGAVPEGESPESAGRRLVMEQTAVVADGDVFEVWHGYLPTAPVEVYFLVVSVEAGDKDLSQPPSVHNEFVAGPEALSGRTFTAASGFVLGRFPDALHALRGDWDVRDIA